MAIAKNPSTNIEALRQRALKKFQQVGFPKPKCEEYRYTPITQLLSPHFSATNSTTATFSRYHAFHPFSAGGMNENRLVFINGRFDKNYSTWRHDAKLEIYGLSEALTIHPNLVGAHLAKYEDGKDPFSLLNTAKWQDGAFIRVPKNTTVSKPLIIHYLHDAQQEKIAAHTRLLVMVEENSKLDIIESTDSVGGHTIFHTTNEEIVVRENATLNYCKIQNDKGLLHKVTNTYINQSDASRIKTHTFTLAGKLIRNNLNVQIDGKRCEAYLYGLYVARNKTLIDNHTVVDHRKPNSYSNELYKGIIGENAQGVFNGKIYVRPQAQQTNAFQSNKNILFSDTSTVHAKPQLEIWADDVKCSHGCTSGQMDDDALFYLQSRGITKAESRALLLQAFASEAFNAIENKALKEIVHGIVSAHLQDGFGI